MRKFFAFLFLFVAVLLFAKLSFAQSSSQSATAVNLSFPIAELGNCSSAQDCKTYCDDPTHVDACVAYAKAHGFYKESALDTEKEAILADAKTTLGCDSISSCATFCQQSANATACSSFAQKHNLRGGQQNLDNTTLQKAEQVLGCTSIDSCRTFCSDSAHKDKCAAFAKENHLRGGDETVGPGGCTSESSCKTFCANPNNFQACSHFVREHEASDSAKPFTGPGGCTSEDSCKAFCSQNPTACHLNPSPTPNSTEGETNSNSGSTPVPTAMSKEAYCRLYPSHCEGLTPTSYQNYPSTSPTQVPTPNYQAYCQTKGKSCFFNGSTCVCPTPTQSTNSNEGSGNTANTPTPTQSAATPTPTGTVEGATTHVNFFQWLMEKVLHLQ